jgi:ketosteroid isomerase-like protein
MSNREIIENVYGAFGRGDVPAVLEAFDPKIEWREAENNPYQMSGNAWVGGDAILQNLFVKLGEDWDGFTVTPKHYHDAGDSVVAEGRYTGTHKTTGKAIDMQFCHIWKLANGRVQSFQQYCDTAQIQDAAGVR